MQRLSEDFSIYFRNRLDSIDEALAAENRLLEFCVDTQDPRAHRHQKIIDLLRTVRKTYIEDLKSSAVFETNAKKYVDEVENFAKNG